MILTGNLHSPPADLLTLIRLCFPPPPSYSPLPLPLPPILCRPLSYSCAFSTALCDFSVTKGPHDPGSQRTLVYANMKQPIHLPVPTMSGYLMICTGWVNMFWKRPLIVEYRIRLYRDRVPVPSRTNGTYFCQLISPESAEVSKELEIPPPSRNRRTLECIYMVHRVLSLSQFQAALCQLFPAAVFPLCIQIPKVSIYLSMAI